MPRVKRGTSHVAKRKKLLKSTKGYKWGRKKTIKLARPAALKAGSYALRDRRVKKRTYRRLWQIKINAAVREHGLSYSKFINLLKKNKIEMDRKILADLAEHEPKVFAQIIKQVKK
ncbi:50S ribosomal protein L20 [Patescibacteria group bacterium]|nr:50S ribosomal protein L20 [Patescibacteria group bacterium]